VAIVGSGSGNDVATALRMGAAHVDAIEIDPAIRVSRDKYHPGGRMTTLALRCRFNDARNFFRTADQKYDLIVYGVLGFAYGIKPCVQSARGFLRVYARRNRRSI